MDEAARPLITNRNGSAQHGLLKAATTSRVILGQEVIAELKRKATHGRVERLVQASRLVRKASMRVNREFAAIESDPGAPRGARRDKVGQKAR